ncbi:MATE family efflux transporter [Campylobacter californiensis]|uniref:MATE family efflux transporter n=1 Tax=Campylobacter californiensis TaxID=1032243 RepID=UPI00147451D6|nr:MATE family efflux transporter [Campylobacter sp. RM12916]MBE3610444.1 MATE family efflux transporter [Campylobacter sp. RM12916]
MAINLISSIIVFMVSMGINFFLTPYILKSLGNEAFGFVGLSNAIVSYAAVITVAINSVSGRFVAYEWHKGNLERANSYYSSVLAVNFIFALFVVVASGIFILNLDVILNVPSHIKTDVTLTFVFYFINFCVGLFNGVITVCAFVRNKLYLLSIRNAISSAILATLIVLLFYLFSAMITYIAISALISSIFVLLSTIYMSKRITPELKFDLKIFDFNKIKELLNSGVWNSFNALNRILLTGMDLFICNIFINAWMTGILATAKAAPIILESFVAQLSSIFSPKFVEFYSKGNILALINEAKFSMRTVAFIMSAPAAFFVVFGRDFYSLWLPFKSADEITLIYNLSMITLVPIVFISYLFSLFGIDSATNKLRRPAIANTILGVSTILAQICIVKFSDYGIYGIAIVGAGFYCIRILFFDLINAALNLDVKLTTFYGVYLRNLALFVFVCMIYYAISRLVSIQSWIDLAFALVALLAFGYIINLFLIFNKFEQRILMNKILAKFKRNL